MINKIQTFKDKETSPKHQGILQIAYASQENNSPSLTAQRDKKATNSYPDACLHFHPDEIDEKEHCLNLNLVISVSVTSIPGIIITELCSDWGGNAITHRQIPTISMNLMMFPTLARL